MSGRSPPLFLSFVLPSGSEEVFMMVVFLLFFPYPSLQQRFGPSPPLLTTSSIKSSSPRPTSLLTKQNSVFSPELFPPVVSGKNSTCLLSSAVHPPQKKASSDLGFFFPSERKKFFSFRRPTKSAAFLETPSVKVSLSLAHPRSGKEILMNIATFFFPCS